MFKVLASRVFGKPHIVLIDDMWHVSVMNSYTAKYLRGYWKEAQAFADKLNKERSNA